MVFSPFQPNGTDAQCRQHRVPIVQYHDSLWAAADMLAKAPMDWGLVLDQGQVVGRLTAQRILKALVAIAPAPPTLPPPTATVANWVEPIPTLIDSLTPEQVGEQFQRSGLSVLPLVNAQGQLVKLVSRPLQTSGLAVQLAEQSPNPIFAVDVEGRILHWNGACTRLWGETAGIRGASLHTVLQPRLTHQNLEDVLAAVFTGQSYSNVEITYRSPMGHEWVMLSRLYPLYGAMGQVICCAFANTDITPLKQAARFLQAEEKRFRAIFDQAPVGFCQTEVTGVMQWANPWFADLLGYSIPDLIGRTWQSITLPEDLPGDVALNEALIAGELPAFSMEKRYLTREGKAHWVHITVCSLRDAKGHLYATLSVVQDIHDRKRAEQELQRSEERYTLATQEGQVGVWDWDLQRGDIYLSPNLKALLGYRDDEIANHIDAWSAYVCPEDQPLVAAAVEAVLSGRRDRFEVLHRMVHKDGHLLWVLARGRLFRDGQGTPVRMAGTDTDVTALKRTELALRASHSRMVDILESITDGFVALDQQLRFTYVNQRAEEMMHSHREELLGYCIWDCFPAARGTIFQTAYETALREATTQTFEAFYPPLDTWYEFHVYPTPNGLTAYFQDISARKQAYERLTYQVQREQALNQVLQAIHQSLDLETVFATTAEAISPLLGGCWVTIVQYEAALAAWQVRFAYHGAGNPPVTTGPDVPDRDNPLADQLRAFQTVCINNTETLQSDPVNGPLAENREESWLLVPLEITGQPLPWGSFSLSRSRQQAPDGWHPEEIELAQTVARQLAIAIQQAQAYAQAQQELQERQRAEDRLREAQRLARLGNWEVTLPQEQWRWSEQMFQLFGLPVTPMPPDLATQLSSIHPEDRDLWRTAMATARATGEAFQLECRLCPVGADPEASLRYVSLLGETELGPRGQVVRLFGTLMDITERRQFEDQLTYEAYHDPLTGVPNRAFFMDYLQMASEQTQTGEIQGFAVLFIDLDRFKVINDSLGHLSGDRLLIACANRLGAIAGTQDLFARLSGDEFALLLADIPDLGQAIAMAERLQTALETPFLVDGRELGITASIGIASSLNGSIDPVDCLRDADIAMFQAKGQGRNRHVLFDPAMHAENTTRLILETDLQRAIDRNELQVVYQPIVRLDTGQISGFEALMRWYHPHFGPIQPSDFIPLAEETGAILTIGRWIRDRACIQLRQWQQTLPQAQDLTMSVNLSVKQFASLQLLDRIQETLATTGLSGRSLRLEITESALIDNPEMAASILQTLRQQQIELCIDDFGTGYSSLSMVHQYPVQILKIDRSFVNRLEADPRGVTMVRTIIALAHSLDMEVIAEGVETVGQLHILRELGCESAQGFFFSCPLSAREAAALITQSPPWPVPMT